MRLGSVRDGSGDAGQVLEIVEEGLRRVVMGPARDFEIEKPEESAGHLRPVANIRTQGAGGEDFPEKVGIPGRARDGKEPLGARVRLLQVPDAVDRDGGEGLVAFQDMGDRCRDRVPDIVAPARMGRLRCEARGHQHDVAFRSGHIERLAYLPDRVAAGFRAPGFEKAEMALGEARVEREVELAESSARAPRFQKRSERVLWSVHQKCHAPFSRQCVIEAIT